MSCHPGKLNGPGDCKNEENYLRMQLTAAASLAAAATHRQDSNAEEIDVSQIASSVRNAAPSYHRLEELSWKNRILWVDDRSENNIYERAAFAAVGLSFSLASSTKEALNILERSRFAAIISDMGRHEGPREGYALLEILRNKGDQILFFIYAGPILLEHKPEAQQREAQGNTIDPQELFKLVTRAVIQGQE